MRFLATGHIGVSSLPNHKLPTRVLSVLFHICLAGGQQGQEVHKLYLSVPGADLDAAGCVHPVWWEGKPRKQHWRALSLSPKVAHTNKAGGVEVSGRKNWQKLNACYRTGIRNTTKPSNSKQQAWKKMCILELWLVWGGNRGVCLQYTMCYNTHCEQEPSSPGQVAMSGCWTGRQVVASVSWSGGVLV